MKGKIIALVLVLGILAISGCITVQSKRPSPVAQQSEVNPEAIIDRLEKNYGPPVKYAIEYTEIDGKKICIEKYWYQVSSDVPVYIVVTIDNGRICRMYTIGGG